MYTSDTIGYSAIDFRGTRSIVRAAADDKATPRTVRVRPGRSTARRAAINASRYGR